MVASEKGRGTPARVTLFAWNGEKRTGYRSLPRIANLSTHANNKPAGDGGHGSGHGTVRPTT